MSPDIIKLAQDIARGLVDSSNDQSVLVSEAERILHVIRGRDFREANVSLTDESQLVLLILGRARTMLNESLQLWREVRAANQTLRELRARFVVLLGRSAQVVESARQALAINSISRGYDSQVTTKLSDYGQQMTPVCDFFYRCRNGWLSLPIGLKKPASCKIFKKNLFDRSILTIISFQLTLLHGL